MSLLVMFRQHTAQLASAVTVYINGVDRTKYVNRYESEIDDELNETPNTCTLMVRGFTPAREQIVQVWQQYDLIFAGRVKSIEQVQRRVGTRLRYRLSCLDWTHDLDHRLVNRNYVADAADDIAADLLVRYTSGFSGAYIEDGLDVVDLPNKMEQVTQALARLANLAGAFYKVDYYRRLHFRITESLTAPTAITTANTTAKVLRHYEDGLQIHNRVMVEGLGTTALGSVLAGDTILPLESVDNFSASGGELITGSQRLTYTAAVAGGAGTLIGPGAAPSGAPGLALAAGTGVETGLHFYAYTDVTAAGETLPSGLGSITTDVIAAPTDAPAPQSFAGPGVGSLSAGTYLWAATNVNSSGETTAGPTVSIVVPAGGYTVNFHVPLGPAGTTSRKFYRTAVGGTQLKLQGTIPDNVNLAWSDGVADGSLGANVPTTNTASANHVSITGIAIGATGTTSRKVYRTVAGGTQLKLLTTIADNITTTYSDATADASLGANAPTSDTSGLTQPDGQINAGATMLLTAGAGVFATGGGWAVIGNGQQVIRYTGISGNTLTGIPTTGVGAITGTVSYNTSITVASVVTGIPASGTGALEVDLVAGDDINLLWVENDIAAQTTLAALDSSGRDDGVREHYIQDRRLSLDGASARALAELALSSAADERVTYTTEDAATQSGAEVTVTISGISTTVRIQQVRIYWVPGRKMAQRDVAASNQFKSYYQYVRDIQNKAEKVA